MRVVVVEVDEVRQSRRSVGRQSTGRGTGAVAGREFPARQSVFRGSAIRSAPVIIAEIQLCVTPFE